MSKKSTADQVVDLLATLERESYAAGFEAGRAAMLASIQKIANGDVPFEVPVRQRPQKERAVPTRHVPNGVSQLRVLSAILFDGARTSPEVFKAVLNRTPAGTPVASEGSIYSILARMRHAEAIVNNGKAAHNVQVFDIGHGWNRFVDVAGLSPGDRESLQVKSNSPDGE